MARETKWQKEMTSRVDDIEKGVVFWSRQVHCLRDGHCWGPDGPLYRIRWGEVDETDGWFKVSRRCSRCETAEDKDFHHTPRGRRLAAAWACGVTPGWQWPWERISNVALIVLVWIGIIGMVVLAMFGVIHLAQMLT